MSRPFLTTLALALLTAIPPVHAADNALLAAAAAGDVAAVRALLKQGHDVNTAGPDGATALHWAVRANHTEIARILLTAGATVSAART